MAYSLPNKRRDTMNTFDIHYRSPAHDDWFRFEGPVLTDPAKVAEELAETLDQWGDITDFRVKVYSNVAATVDASAVFAEEVLKLRPHLERVSALGGYEPLPLEAAE